MGKVRAPAPGKTWLWSTPALGPCLTVTIFKIKCTISIEMKINHSYALSTHGGILNEHCYYRTIYN